MTPFDFHSLHLLPARVNDVYTTLFTWLFCFPSPTPTDDEQRMISLSSEVDGVVFMM